MTKRPKCEVQDLRFVMYQDPNPSTDYLEQPENSDRKKLFDAGDFYFVGIRAECDLLIPLYGGSSFIIQTIVSGGLWGIEDDSGEDYFDSIALEELETLTHILNVLKAEVPDEWKNMKAKNIKFYQATDKPSLQFRMVDKT